MTPEDELARVMGLPLAPKRTATVTCPQCDGNCTIAGPVAGEHLVCATCGGAGTVTIETPIRPNA